MIDSLSTFAVRAAGFAYILAAGPTIAGYVVVDAVKRWATR